MEPPQLPPAPEVINSTVGGDVDLRSKPNACGMFRNLEALEQRYQEMLAQHPELEPLILQTPKGPVEIRVTEKRLALSPTPLPGRPYAEVQQTPQVRIYVLRKTIQGLEAALCGEAGEIEVNRPVRRNRAQENLIHHLRAGEVRQPGGAGAPFPQEPLCLRAGARDPLSASEGPGHRSGRHY